MSTSGLPFPAAITLPEDFDPRSTDHVSGTPSGRINETIDNLGVALTDTQIAWEISHLKAGDTFSTVVKV